MPLVTKEFRASPSRAPWRGVLAGAITALLFLCVLAFVARATRDAPHHALASGEIAQTIRETPVVVALLDAGSLDAGELPGENVLGPERDTGPAMVPGPPIIAADVVAVVLPILEECVRRALRFDPALGGPMSMRIVVSGGRLLPSLLSSPSPVLTRCMAARGTEIVWPTAEGERHVVAAQLAIEGIRAVVRVASAELTSVGE